jgi:DNA polymerase III sliding clamp (beta) subunit (PCNA family)
MSKDLTGIEFSMPPYSLLQTLSKIAPAAKADKGALFNNHVVLERTGGLLLVRARGKDHEATLRVPTTELVGSDGAVVLALDALTDTLKGIEKGEVAAFSMQTKSTRLAVPNSRQEGGEFVQAKSHLVIKSGKSKSTILAVPYDGDTRRAGQHIITFCLPRNEFFNSASLVVPFTSDAQSRLENVYFNLVPAEKICHIFTTSGVSIAMASLPASEINQTHNRTKHTFPVPAGLFSKLLPALSFGVDSATVQLEFYETCVVLRCGSATVVLTLAVDEPPDIHSIIGSVCVGSSISAKGAAFKSAVTRATLFAQQQFGIVPLWIRFGDPSAIFSRDEKGQSVSLIEGAVCQVPEGQSFSYVLVSPDLLKEIVRSVSDFPKLEVRFDKITSPVLGLLVHSGEYWKILVAGMVDDRPPVPDQSLIGLYSRITQEVA